MPIAHDAETSTSITSRANVWGQAFGFLSNEWSGFPHTAAIPAARNSSASDHTAKLSPRWSRSAQEKLRNPDQSVRFFQLRTIRR
jgi:hypothetical protein